MVDHKQTMNCKLQDSDLFFNLLDETDNEMKKMNEKIIVQKAEILKTKSMMDLFEECFLKQNEMLTRLIEDKNILHEKKELLLASRDWDSDEDEKLVQTNCDGLEIDNCSDLITYKALKNDVKRANTIDCEDDNKRKKLSTDLWLFNDSEMKIYEIKTDSELSSMTLEQTHRYIRFIEDRLIYTELERSKFQSQSQSLDTLRKIYHLQSKRFSKASTKMCKLRRQLDRYKKEDQFETPAIPPIKKTKLNKRRKAALRRRNALVSSPASLATFHSSTPSEVGSTPSWQGTPMNYNSPRPDLE